MAKRFAQVLLGCCVYCLSFVFISWTIPLSALNKRFWSIFIVTFALAVSCILRDVRHTKQVCKSCTCGCMFQALSTPRRRNLKTEVLLWKRIKCFPSTLRRRNSKTQQSAVSLDLCLRETRAGKSRDYRDAIIFEKLGFQIVFRRHENEKPGFSNPYCLKSVFRFRDGLVWTKGLTVEMNVANRVFTQSNPF